MFDTTLPYRVMDADNHFYETPDCFSRHIERRYAAKAITASQAADGSWKVMVGDRPFRFMDVKFDRTNPPGSLHEILRAKDRTGDLKWGDSYSKENMLAAFQHRDAAAQLHISDPDWRGHHGAGVCAGHSPHLSADFLRRGRLRGSRVAARVLPRRQRAPPQQG